MIQFQRTPDYINDRNDRIDIKPEHPVVSVNSVILFEPHKHFI